MTTAKLFQHGDSHPLRLPRALWFEGTDVCIEKRNHAVILKPVHKAKPKAKFKTFAEIGEYLAEKFPEADAEGFPARPPQRVKGLTVLE